MKNKQANIKKNYILSIFSNILSLVVPLITTPYISRTLGAENIGIYSFCLSIETYFVVLGTLGLPTYAKRTIASNRNNKKRLNKLFSELLLLQATTLLIAIAIYVVTIFIINQYRVIFLISGIGIMAAIFDISWLFIGVEDFSTIVKKNISFRLLSIILILIFVKNENDLVIYSLIMMLSNLICNLLLFKNANKLIKFEKPKISKIVKHLKPSAFLLLPTMVTSIYAVIDKTMIGAISGDMSEVGLYEQSQKIITISLALITSIGAVLMPRITALYTSGNIKDFQKYINKGMSAITLISMPIIFGCIAISETLVPWFYGDGFEKIIVLLRIFSPIYIALGISDLVGTQLLVSIGEEKKLLIINLSTTAINLTINAILIPKYLSYGAAVATLISEFIKAIIVVMIGRNYISIKKIFASIIKYASLSIVMYLIINIAKQSFFYAPTAENTIVLILIGAILYGIFLIITRDYWITQVINRIKISTTLTKDKQ